MTVIFERDTIKLITHDRCRHSYTRSGGGERLAYELKEILFNNFRRKQKEGKSGEAASEKKTVEIKAFLQECKRRNLFENYTSDDEIDRQKTENHELMNLLYKSWSPTSDAGEFRGENSTECGQIFFKNGTVSNSYLIPPACRFFNKNVMEIENFLSPQTEKFDFIVIDPPWKCRYIKRLKKKCDTKSYSMMSNEEIANIPLGKYTHASTVVVVWCTNSATHESFVKDTLLTKWDLKLTAVWRWMKVDKMGEAFCPFDGSGSKKPYEKIFIGTHSRSESPLEGKEITIVSRPSSIHSHKPPLLNLFRHILPERPKCLELFARSLYGNFTSVGTEVLKLQNTLLYERVSDERLT